MRGLVYHQLVYHSWNHIYITFSEKLLAYPHVAGHESGTKRTEWFPKVNSLVERRTRIWAQSLSRVLSRCHPVAATFKSWHLSQGSRECLDMAGGEEWAEGQSEGSASLSAYLGGCSSHPELGCSHTRDRDCHLHPSFRGKAYNWRPHGYQQ